MLRREPVKKLSRQRTSAPCAIKRSQRWEPIKPAPPVTNTRLSTDIYFSRNLCLTRGHFAALRRRRTFLLREFERRHRGAAAFGFGDVCRSPNAIVRRERSDAMDTRKLRFVAIDIVVHRLKLDEFVLM